LAERLLGEHHTIGLLGLHHLADRLVGVDERRRRLARDELVVPGLLRPVAIRRERERLLGGDAFSVLHGRAEDAAATATTAGPAGAIEPDDAEPDLPGFAGALREVHCLPAV